MKTKTIKVDNQSTRGFWTRSIFKKSMDKVISDEAKKGWRLSSNTPVAGRGGATTHYILVFEKD